MALKPQDVVVLLKLVQLRWVGAADSVLVAELGMRASEVHAAVKRAATAGLVSPLYRCVPAAVKLDPEPYALLALVDAIRCGRARETALAEQELLRRLDVSTRSTTSGVTT